MTSSHTEARADASVAGGTALIPPDLWDAATRRATPYVLIEANNKKVVLRSRRREGATSSSQIFVPIRALGLNENQLAECKFEPISPWRYWTHRIVRTRWGVLLLVGLALMLVSLVCQAAAAYVVATAGTHSSEPVHGVLISAAAILQLISAGILAFRGFMRED
jgi:hypothetical protein